MAYGMGDCTLKTRNEKSLVFFRVNMMTFRLSTPNCKSNTWSWRRTVNRWLLSTPLNLSRWSKRRTMRLLSFRVWLAVHALILAQMEGCLYHDDFTFTDSFANAVRKNEDLQNKFLLLQQKQNANEVRLLPVPKLYWFERNYGSIFYF